MENERIRITLNKSDNVYIAGETIVGEIVLNLVKRTKIRAVKVQITGKGKCKWIEIMRKNTNVDNKSLFYAGLEVYVRDQISLLAFEPRGLELNPGEHKLEFNIPLRCDLPSTFKGSYGTIKYKLRILLQRPWMFDERHVIPVTVIKSMPLLLWHRLNPMPIEKQITKTISLFGNRPITMVASLPKNFAIRGEPMPICVSVSNGSNTTVEKIRFTVLQCITYWSVLPVRRDRSEVIIIATKETGAVHKKSERRFAHDLVIPVTAQPSDNIRSGIVNISYELKVEAVLRGFFKNLTLTFPFEVYSNYVANSETTISNNREAHCNEYINTTLPGNPFENGTEITPPITIYPFREEHSINSPNHMISSYGSNSESSSLNSIASDSSTATLSPAIGGATTLSCTSESSSSQFNSPSTRASLYSATNVPYMPYHSTNSPITTATSIVVTTATLTSSTPPTYSQAFNEMSQQQQHQRQQIQQHQQHDQSQEQQQSASTILPQSLTVNLNNTSSYTSTSISSSFLTIRPPSGAHELPPSYEELFGTAPESLQDSPN